MNHLNRITYNPNQCGGQPCIRGMRIRVKDIFDLLANGASHAEILQDYPYLEEEDIIACLQFASAQAGQTKRQVIGRTNKLIFYLILYIHFLYLVCAAFDLNYYFINNKFKKEFSEIPASSHNYAILHNNDISMLDGNNYNIMANIVILTLFSLLHLVLFLKIVYSKKGLDEHQHI